jgi:hypothetical protein
MRMAAIRSSLSIFIQSTQQYANDYVVYSVDIQNEFIPSLERIAHEKNSGPSEEDGRIISELLASGYSNDHAGFPNNYAGKPAGANERIEIGRAHV